MHHHLQEAATATIHESMTAGNASSATLNAIAVSLESYAEAIAAASTEAQIEAAGEVYATDIVGSITTFGALDTHLKAALGLAGGITFDAAVQAVATLATTFHSAVSAAAMASTAAGGSIDGSAVAKAVAEAHATYEAGASAVFEAHLGTVLDKTDLALAAGVTADVFATLAH